MKKIAAAPYDPKHEIECLRSTIAELCSMPEDKANEEIVRLRAYRKRAKYAYIGLQAAYNDLLRRFQKLEAERDDLWNEKEDLKRAKYALEEENRYLRGFAYAEK